MYCKLVIPDSGPLISLASVNRLEYLTYTKAPIIVPDAAVYETTLDITGNFTDVNLIADFIIHNASSIYTHSGFRLLKSITAPNLKRERSLGEQAISDILRSMRHDPYWNDSYSMVLFEDIDVMDAVFTLAKTLPNKVRCISTPMYLFALEANKLIPSAEAVLNEMKEKGRVFKDNIKNIDSMAGGFDLR